MEQTHKGTFFRLFCPSPELELGAGLGLQMKSVVPARGPVVLRLKASLGLTVSIRILGKYSHWVFLLCFQRFSFWKVKDFDLIWLKSEVIRKEWGCLKTTELGLVERISECSRNSCKDLKLWTRVERDNKNVKIIVHLTHCFPVLENMSMNLFFRL